MRRRGFLKSMGVGGSALIGVELTARAARAGSKPPSLWDRLKERQVVFKARLSRYDGPRLLRSVDVPLDGGRMARGEIDGATWSITAKTVLVPERSDAADVYLRFKLVKGRAHEASVAVALTFSGWSRDNYVLLPGSCYKGNRFESRHISYPPLLTEPADIGPNVPTIISDIPRLNLRAGSSRIQLLTGDLATPAIGVQSPRERGGFWLLTDPTTPLGISGITVEESEDRGQATILVTAPGVRQDFGYRIANTRLPSSDRGADLKPGDEVTVRARIYLFDCPEVQGLFDRFIAIRKDLSGPTKLRHQLPFSAAWKIHEARWNRESWVEKRGYFAVGARDTVYTDWQTGWCGGLMATLPLLFGGDAQSRERVLRNFDFVFPGGQARSGFFHSLSDGQQWFEDGFVKEGTPSKEGTPPVAKSVAYRHAKKWHLVRRSADVLYFMTKQLMLLEKQEPTVKPKTAWTKGVTRCADAFVRLWDRNRQLGQFVNIETGDIVVGGSSSAGIAPAGLALASQHFKRPEYLRVAKEAGQYFYDKCVRAGVTTGGPPDALQCPDSESATGLLESFVVLHEITGDAAWADRAAEIAHQLASWVISYDFRLAAPPPDGKTDEHDVQTTGAIFTNAQSMHGSPGFFLESGDALLKLYRATKKVVYLELLRDTAHNLTQYAGYLERPTQPRPRPGTICPRVNTSDWLDPVGEVVPTSVPLEVCGMLTYVEVPGVYVQPDTAFVFAIDHVTTTIKEKTPSRLVVTIRNPTKFEAAVRVLAENAIDTVKPLGANALLRGRVVTLAPGAEEDVAFDRDQA